MNKLTDHWWTMLAIVAMVIGGIISSQRGDVAGTVFYMGLLNVMTMAVLIK